ncbi:MAG TPA: LuxR C-terminal-related transcriptional regulator [Solimonas sp.]
MRSASESCLRQAEDWDAPTARVVEYLQRPAAPASPQLQALEQARSLSLLLQGYLQKSPEALVFLDSGGTILYKSAHGEAQFDRWNRTLARGQESSSLPAALRLAVLGGNHPLQLQHPQLPGLSASLEPIPGGFVLRLTDDQTLGSSNELSAQALAALKKLSVSEQRVARLAVEGLRNDQIAKRLSRSPRTIEFQLHCSFRKLGVSNRVQLSRLLS